jgi:hypothetical protein
MMTWVAYSFKFKLGEGCRMAFVVSVERIGEEVETSNVK